MEKTNILEIIYALLGVIFTIFIIRYLFALDLNYNELRALLIDIPSKEYVKSISVRQASNVPGISFYVKLKNSTLTTEEMRTCLDEISNNIDKYVYPESTCDYGRNVLLSVSAKNNNGEQIRISGDQHIESYVAEPKDIDDYYYVWEVKVDIEPS